MLRHWREAHEHLLNVLPPGRRLLLETGSLSASLPRLAEFAAVPLDRLDGSAAHLHRREAIKTLRPDLDQAWVSDAVERDCATMWRTLRAAQCA